MSRSSAGFADFFPTAPSVLQQKRFKTVQGHPRPKATKDEKSEEISPRDTQPETVNDSMHSGASDQTVSGSHDEFTTPSETLGAGSTSSRSNGISAVNAPFPQDSTSKLTELRPNTLTPLTNVGSSPPGKSSPLPTKATNGVVEANQKPRFEEKRSTITPLHTPPTPQPQTHNVSGCRLIYDPDNDKRSSSSKDRRKKPEYADFAANGQDEHPPDPRLSILNYTRGAGCKQKSKYRPAPYMLRQWPYDSSTTIGPGPPTQIVVTGFDPLTPIAPISALFSSFGEIAEINNRTDPITGRFLGICSIKYKDSISFRGGNPIIAATAARRAYYE